MIEEETIDSVEEEEEEIDGRMRGEEGPWEEEDSTGHSHLLLIRGFRSIEEGNFPFYVQN